MKLYKFNSFLIFFSLLLSRAAFGGSAVAQVDRQDGALGEQFNLTITISGDLSGSVELPPIPDMVVAGTGTSTNISYMNGSLSKETSYSFAMEPQKEGSYTVPALKLKIDDQWVTTQAITIRVSNGSGSNGQAGRSRTNPARNPQAGQQDQDESDGQAQKQGRPVFIEREFSKSNPYEGEPIVVTTKIFHSVELANIEAMNEKPAGVRIVDIKQSNTREERDGVVYDVIVVQQALIPTRSGKISVPGFKIRAAVMVAPARQARRRGGRNFDDFFDDFFNRAQGRMERRVVASKDGDLEVKAIPAQGKPANFKEVIGTFRLDSEITHAELKAGETATLTLTIDGVGALDTIGTLDLKLGPNIRVYADKPQGEEHGSEKWGLESKKTFRFALVPTQKGELALGPFKLPYFDPATGKYEELVTDLGKLKVAEGDDKPASAPVITKDDGKSATLKADVQSIGNDLIDIHRRIPLERSQSLSKEDYLWAIGLVGIPGLLCLLVLIFKGLSMRLRGGSQNRKRQAFKNFQMQMERLQSSRLPPPSLLENSYNAYREFIGDTFGLQGSALTAKEIAPKLAKFRLPKEILSQVEDLAAKVEFTQYSSENLAEKQVEGLVAAMRRLSQEIEKQC